MSILKRKPNEDDFKYKVRLCVMKLNKEIDLDWVEIAQLLKLDVSSDHLRKLAYSYREYSEYLQVNGVDNDVLVDIEDKIRDLEKEKIKFQDQKREYRTRLRVDARWEHLRDTIIQEVENMNESKPLERATNIFLNTPMNGDREAILVLSDWHIGMEIDSHWNVFNKEVAKQRVENLMNRTIRYCDEQRVGKLNVLICGDTIHGLIHTNARIESSEDAIKQTMSASEMLSDLVNNLSMDIPKICVYSTHGNHSRAVANYKDSIEGENFEKIIEWYMKSRLQNVKNVEFPDTLIDGEIIELDVFNNKIYAVHGHNDNIAGVINNMAQMTRTFPDMIIMGHYHKDFQTEQFNTSLVVNGSLCGMDQYARSKRLNNVPHQKLIIFDEEDGQLCTYKVKLT